MTKRKTFKPTTCPRKIAHSLLSYRLRNKTKNIVQRLDSMSQALAVEWFIATSSQTMRCSTEVDTDSIGSYGDLSPSIYDVSTLGRDLYTPKTVLLANEFIQYMQAVMSELQYQLNMNCRDAQINRASYMRYSDVLTTAESILTAKSTAVAYLRSLQPEYTMC
jgi:hypothetical protein